ncbi:hypothetical protein ACWGQU_34020, partial [[Kitasatospora] papulosa]
GRRGRGGWIWAAVAVAFRLLLSAVAGTETAGRRGRPGAARTGRPHPLAPVRLLVHSVGRRGPPYPAFTPA